MQKQAGITVAVAIVLATLAAGAFAATVRHTANSQSYPDSIGENPPAPDITSIAVSNDDTGLITWKINISNRPTLTPDMLIVLSLNTDGNTTSGDQSAFGADYLIQLVPGEVDLFKWNATTSDYDNAPSQSTLTFAYDSTGATIKVNASDLGATKAVSFLALAFSGITIASDGSADFTNAHGDIAPDLGHGTFAYQVLAVLKLSVVSFVTTPKVVHAGGKLSASLAANENDTGGPVTGGTVACVATVAGKRLTAVTHTVANGVATCTWKVPPTVKGKTLKGTVTLTVRGATAARSFSVAVH